MKRSEIIFGALRLPVDYFAIMAAFLLAYYLRPITDLIPGVQYTFGSELRPPFDEYLWLAVISAFFLVILFAFNHLYSLKITHRFSKEFFKITFLVSAWLMFIIAYYFLVVHQLFFSRIALAHIWIFAIFLVSLGRILIVVIQSFLLRFGVGQRRVLFIGANALVDRFYQSIKKDRYYKVIGALDETVYSRKKDQLRIVGTLDQLKMIVNKYGVEEIIQAVPQLKDRKASDLHSFCRSRQIKYSFIPDLVRLQRTNVEVQMVDDIPLVSLKETSLDGWGHVYKRLFDILVSLVLIILFIPLWIILAIWIKAGSKGPVIYKSRRQHRDRLFNVYKFRSMVADADLKKEDLLNHNERKGPLFKIKQDPRVTKMGRFLRKTSLDELPQLFNVLIGNMSLVGPRPHLPEEIEQYKSHHYQVFAIKPGMTGLAQISGRSNLDFEEEVKLDVYYIENWSLWMDIKLILKSIGVVFRADGA
ncbi:sugar transferase [Candidatus Peregrinibacteria bacterium]|nr:sugar transferase [Candidatus Peregrinibacteria bacterium]